MTKSIKRSTRRESIEDVCAAIRERLEGNKRVRRSVLEDGRIHIDRMLPFLVLYRAPVGREDPGTDQLATSQASYLVTRRDKRIQSDLLYLVDGVRQVAFDNFGAFVLVEIWSRPPEHPEITNKEQGTRGPGFRLFAHPQSAAADGVLEVLNKRLRDIRSTGRKTTVEVPTQLRDFPRRPKPLDRSAEPAMLQIGIEVEPSFRGADGVQVLPGVLRTLRTGLDRALRHAFFHFARNETTHRPKNFHSLGRRAMVKAVWEADQRLDTISSSFDFLMSVTPINAATLWSSFRKSNYERLPALRYRPLPIDPARSKRELFAIPLERVEDPTMVALLTEKQEELDRRLTMLKDRGTERFLLGSLQLYGRISRDLIRSAEELLERVPGSARPPTAGRSLTPEEFAELARQEIIYYRGMWDQVDATVEIKRNILSGLMVSRGSLYVASDSRTRAGRADALLQHEVGTHLVTYYNGKAQRFTQLKNGLAGYEELQEGLAVLAEYLVSGMTPARLRILAARVLAADAVVDGATFVDAFRLLCRYGFQPRIAFQITLRIYRGGGFIKDCIYLRGLSSLLDYLARGEAFEPLFVGKIALDHLPIMAELKSRKVVSPPKLLPRYLERPSCQERLHALRRGPKLYELLEQDAADD